MITELILNMLHGVFSLIMAPIPELPMIPMPVGLVAWFVNIANATAFILPINHLLTIFALSVTIHNFHILWAIVQKMWTMLPFT